MSELSVDEKRLLMVIRTLEAVFGHGAHKKLKVYAYKLNKKNKKKRIKVGSQISRRIPWDGYTNEYCLEIHSFIVYFFLIR